jgi:uncharacterized protein (TIGR03000 family)
MRPYLWFGALTVASFGLTLLAARADEDQQNDRAEGPPAKVRVYLPPDARLTVNGHATRSRAGVRRFTTPPLEKGKRYRYTFKAEFVRGKNKVTVSRTVVLRAGRRRTISLELPGTTARPGANYGAPRSFTSGRPGTPGVRRFRDMKHDPREGGD